MSMIEYIKEIKRQFRDVYGFKPSKMDGEECCFDKIPDGEYPMNISGEKDYVLVVEGSISCCNPKSRK